MTENEIEHRVTRRQLRLDELTWPEIAHARDRGRRTVVMALGAIEQHGPHLPLGTDSYTGDEIGGRVAERLDAFLAPTLALGCSSHHLPFPGTLSIEPETLAAVIRDVVLSLAAGGFSRLVLVPTHGGNVAPLTRTLAELSVPEGFTVYGLTETDELEAGLLELAERLGIPSSEGGSHAGEIETSAMLVLHPELVHMDRAEPGLVAPPEEASRRLAETGRIEAITPNGVLGDPRRATAERGRAYIDYYADRIGVAVEP